MVGSVEYRCQFSLFAAVFESSVNIFRPAVCPLRRVSFFDERLTLPGTVLVLKIFNAVILIMEGGDFMKKALATIVSLLFVLSVVGLSFAEEKKMEEKKPAMKAMHVTGEVTAVDPAAKTLTIKGKKGEVVLTTTDKTKFAKGKTLADVKVGDKLTAKYAEKDGKMMAWKVMTKEEMKEMKEMKKKEKE